MVGIYKITNPKGKTYIGQSNNILYRWEQYSKLKCKGQPKLYNSITKYGWDNHTKEIICECGLDELNYLETLYKKWELYKVNYNWDMMLFFMVIDGKGGHKSQDTKDKMSISSVRIKRKIKAYTIRGEYVGEFDSPSDAKKILLPEIKDSTGGIIQSCERNKRQKTYHKYIFQYSDDNKINTILKSLTNNIRLKQRKVLQYDLEGNFIREWENSYEIEKETTQQGKKIYSGDVRACCNGKQKTCKGFKWKYGDALLDKEIKINIEEIKKRTENNNKIKKQIKFKLINDVKVLNIIIPCSSKKTIEPEFYFKDFQGRYDEWKNKVYKPKIKAKNLYTGKSWDLYQQSIEYLKQNTPYKIKQHIISAGLGIINPNTKCTSYDCSFTDIHNGFYVKNPKEHFDKLEYTIPREWNKKDTFNIFILTKKYIESFGVENIPKHNSIIISSQNIKFNNFIKIDSRIMELFKLQNEIRLSRLTTLPGALYYIVSNINYLYLTNYFMIKKLIDKNINQVPINKKIINPLNNEELQIIINDLLNDNNPKYKINNLIRNQGLSASNERIKQCISNYELNLTNN